MITNNQLNLASDLGVGLINSATAARTTRAFNTENATRIAVYYVISGVTGNPLPVFQIQGILHEGAGRGSFFDNVGEGNSTANGTKTRAALGANVTEYFWMNITAPITRIRISGGAAGKAFNLATLDIITQGRRP